MPKVFIGIGSNINPECNIPRAIGLLRRTLNVLAISTFYQTEPVGTDGELFYNGVAEIRTEMSPDELKYSVLMWIEEQLGRERTEDKYAPRTIDLDILLYDDLPEYEDREITSRAFLAFPLRELCPDLLLPNSRQPIKDIAESLENIAMKPLPEFTVQLRREIQDEQSQS